MLQSIFCQKKNMRWRERGKPYIPRLRYITWLWLITQEDPLTEELANHALTTEKKWYVLSRYNTKIYLEDDLQDLQNILRNRSNGTTNPYLVFISRKATPFVSKLQQLSSLCDMPVRWWELVYALCWCCIFIGLCTRSKRGCMRRQRFRHV